MLSLERQAPLPQRKDWGLHPRASRHPGSMCEGKKIPARNGITERPPRHTWFFCGLEVLQRRFTVTLSHATLPHSQRAKQRKAMTVKVTCVNRELSAQHEVTGGTCEKPATLATLRGTSLPESCSKVAEFKTDRNCHLCKEPGSPILKCQGRWASNSPRFAECRPLSCNFLVLTNVLWLFRMPVIRAEMTRCGLFSLFLN